MRRISIPGTSLRPSSLCLGSEFMGAGISPDDSYQLLDEYLERGGNIIDTAHIYNDWVAGEKARSEKLIGKWLASRGSRDDLILVTKGMHPNLDTMDVPRSSRAEIRQDLHESLQNLNTDHVDLYFYHRDDPRKPAGEFIEIMNELVQSGLVRYFGCSHWTLPRIKEATEYARRKGLKSFSANQLLWSLAVPNPTVSKYPHMDHETWDFYVSEKVGIMTWSSQAKGFFTKLHTGEPLNEAVKERYLNEENLRRLARAQTLARDLDRSITDVVLSYLTSQEVATVPVLGCRNIAQLRDSLNADSLILSTEAIRFLETGG